jgi:hypothetical protein
VPHLLGHGTSVFKVISERPVILTTKCQGLAKEHSLLQLRNCSVMVLYLAFDHNTSDPAMLKKKLRYTAQSFLRTFKMYFSTLKFSSIKYLLFPNSRHISLPTYIFYPPLFVSTNLFQIICNKVSMALGLQRIHNKRVYWSIEKTIKGLEVF